jgi:hypothetical protein
LARNWTNDTGLALSAANLNALEADVTAALGVPDAALASRVQAGATRTALDGRYAKTTDLANKEPILAEGSVTQFLRGDKMWVELDVQGGGGNVDPEPREAVVNPDNVYAPAGTLLNVPTHVTPAGGQLTHPSVVFVPEGWNGYKYWMAMTPYPTSQVAHEDPNVVASHDGVNWVVPNGLTNPIADADGSPEYHSDVDLRLGPNNTMYLFYRWYAGVAGSGTEEQLRFSTSTDGVNWTAPVNYYVSNETVRRLLSPSMIYEDGAWTMYAVDMLPSPNKVVRLRSESANPASPWTEPVIINPGTMISGKEPWHISIIKTGGRYYGLVNDCTLDNPGSNGEILFISSGDGENFTSSGVGVIPKAVAGKHDGLYRATMIPSTESGRSGFRVWYTGWTNSGGPSNWWLFQTFLGAGRWKSLTLQNAWVNYVGGGGYSQTGLRYKREGRTVTVEGTVRSGALNTVIATLPADAQPLNTAMYPVNSQGTLGMVSIQGSTNTSVAGQISFFTGTAAPTYMTISIKFEVD